MGNEGWLESGRRIRGVAVERPEYRRNRGRRCRLAVRVGRDGPVF